MEETVLAIDIGATKIEAGIVTAEGVIRSRCKMPTPSHGSAGEVFGAVLAAAKDVVDGHAPKSCGVGVPGSVDDTGNVWTLNIPSWQGFGLRDVLAQHLTLPVIIENDARAMTLAEGWMGAAHGVDNFVALVVSTGIGAGIVLNGELLKGNGRAGRLGHICVEPNGRTCDCGGVGCLEAEASGRSIEKITGRSAIGASSDVVERTGMLVGRGIVTVANLLDLHLAVIGGSVALGFGEPFFEAVRNEVTTRSTLGTRSKCDIRVVPVGLAHDAPLLGAAAVALRAG